MDCNFFFPFFPRPPFEESSDECCRNYFASFQNAAENSSLYQRGIAFSNENSLNGFYSDAANGTLPEVSWVFPPGALTEHPPHTPSDGAWFMKNIVDAVTHGPNWNSTILLICYDGKLFHACFNNMVIPNTLMPKMH